MLGVTKELHCHFRGIRDLLNMECIKCQRLLALKCIAQHCTIKGLIKYSHGKFWKMDLFYTILAFQCVHSLISWRLTILPIFQKKDITQMRQPMFKCFVNSKHQKQMRDYCSSWQNFLTLSNNLREKDRVKQLYNVIRTARAHLCWLEKQRTPCFSLFSKILLPSGKDDSCQKSWFVWEQGICYHGPIACLRETGTHFHGCWQASQYCYILGSSLHFALNWQSELLGTTLFYSLLKKLKFVVCLILQADEAFHYLTSNTL